MYSYSWVVCGLLVTHCASAADLAPTVAALPPMRFLGGISGDEFYSRIIQTPLFTKTRRDLVGSPIELRVYHTTHTSQGGRVGGAVSGILAASTLGLLPAVLSSEHAINYEIAVNGVVLSSYTYKKSYTQSRSLWNNKDTTDGLGKDGLEWAKSTVDQFLKDSQSDPKLAGLVSEYDFYFGNAQ